MATTRFKTTTDAIKGGLKNLPIDKAVQNIEGWEDYLHKHDEPGVKAVLADLGKLKKLLQAGEVDSEAIQKLMTKLGKETVKSAGKEDNADAKHIRELGEALSSAAEDSDEEEEDDDDDDEDEDEAVVISDEDEDDDEEEDLDDDEDDELEDEDDEDEDDEELDDDEEVDEKPASKPPAKKAAKKAPAKAAKKSK